MKDFLWLNFFFSCKGMNNVFDWDSLRTKWSYASSFKKTFWPAGHPVFKRGAQNSSAQKQTVNKKWAWTAEFTVTHLCRCLALQSEGLWICNLQTCAYMQLLIIQKKNNSMQGWLVKKCAEGCYMSLDVICIIDIGGRWMSITVQQLACV